MKKHLKFLIVFVILAWQTDLIAQECISATGGEATGGGGTVSFTIGQVAYTIDQGYTGSTIKGVQQPFEFISLGVEDAEGIELQCIAYPNPTSDFIRLKIDNYDLENLDYELYDLTGKLLQSQKISDRLTTISMRDLPPSQYFLKVSETGQSLKTFKIIKNQ
ncbi:MAG: T9SS type A sorting domain-containing protein [Bacteroidales bacterium]|jgi:hypothetical protein|nr:T9SS type A sorting domain-containing protein [Bacteroidales bacterium]